MQPIDSSEALHHSTVYGGQSYSEDELIRAKNVAAAVGAPPTMTPAQMASAIRMVTGGKLLTTATARIPVQPSAEPEQDLTSQKTDVRRVIKRLVAQLNRITETPHALIHHQLNQQLGGTIATATLESLNRRMDVLERLLRSARGR
ncbi:hypothetical protein OG906_42925 (plasmid) [Streptomyces sp. NBC_01426]|uniref:hypothetical protein n=1 Tax=Streptomyces sp. NBC_01426 TaxID=2975866 RepID=UPI002E2F5579|nr:hypothetical protein [Streptomyces sp. NBC_01426]